VNDLATLTAQPTRLSIGGDTYLAYPLTIGEFGEMQAFVDRTFGDPFTLAQAQIATGKYTVAQQQFLLKTAMELSQRGKPLLGTPEADERVRSNEGVKYLIYLSIRKGRPDFTEAAAGALFDRMTPGDIEMLFRATDADKVLSDPKAPMPDGAEPSPS
jgi:hypothetical protein